MRAAIREAKKAYDKEEVPIGAVIVKDGKVVAKGHNQVLLKHDATCHGEMQAIRKASKRLKSFSLEECEIYTTGEPCPMCLSAIIWANIKVVYYGNTKEDAADIGFRDDMIYSYLQNVENSSLLEMRMMDRAETIKTFKTFKTFKIR